VAVVHSLVTGTKGKRGEQTEIVSWWGKMRMEGNRRRELFAGVHSMI
jgi:hypothetical protein